MIPVRRLVRLTAVGAATLGTLAGCAATSANASTVPTPGTTSASPGPVTSGLATAAPPTSAAPGLVNTGTAWPKVIPSMIAYGQWLIANPNPALATTITQPGCASANALTAQLQSLVEQRAYVKTAAPTLTYVSGPTGTAAGNPVTVDIQLTRPAEQILSHTATSTVKGDKTVVLSDRAQLPPTSLHLSLWLGADKKWRFCDIADAVNDPDGEAITTLF
ncbi:hypothetical protein [Paractinoplanes lichenicola]|uniref:Lipoprotein n=1 Tax=Paractinoplanes lichenicola TaxID=2802976 RepID=A0ABS1W0I6_9ACTN|nr:hypothetical protein [Actinoplanes lichenicola]MBL7260203.1 hypothetical protein [Actinoplanes lichenicola]